LKYHQLVATFRRAPLRPHKVARTIADALGGAAQLLEAVSYVVHEGARWRDVAVVLADSAGRLRLLWRRVECADGSHQEHGPHGLREPT